MESPEGSVHNRTPLFTSYAPPPNPLLSTSPSPLPSFATTAVTTHFPANSPLGTTSYDSDDEMAPQAEEEILSAHFCVRVLRRDVQAQLPVQRVFAVASVMAFFSLLTLFTSLTLAPPSLSLLAAAFYSAFTACALFVSLSSLVLMRRGATRVFSYGVERAEVLGVFAVASLMLFVALFIFKEAVELFVEAPHVHALSPVLLHFSLLGLALNAICFALFPRELTLKADVDAPNPPLLAKHGELVANGLLFLNFLLMPALPHVDTLIASCIAILMLVKALPALTSSARVLLQSVPRSVASLLEHSLSQLRSEGVITDVISQHCWTFAPGVYVATLNLRSPPHLHQDQVVARAYELMSPYIRHLTVQVEV